MNIETKWLEDFLSLANTQNFSRSAEDRHLTQPAFSRRIQSLEAAVGCELVDRRSFPVQLTAEGRVFQETAQNLIEQLRNCISHMQSLNNRSHSVIDFAVSHTLSISLFPEFLQSVQKELPSITVRQIVANADDCVNALKNGLCEYLFAFEDLSLNDDAVFKKQKLKSESLIPVCKTRDDGKPIYNLDDPELFDFPYLSYPEGIYLGRLVKQLMNRPPRAIKLDSTFESPMADSLKSMAIQGAGIAWIPSFSVVEELERGSLVRCGGEQWHVPLNVFIYRQNRDLASDAENLWQLLMLQDHLINIGSKAAGND